ncbi:MAG: TolC family protein [Chitinophagaceae bacterium]|nr:TolC family protein [Chitinophagaceae bacterium]
MIRSLKIILFNWCVALLISPCTLVQAQQDTLISLKDAVQLSIERYPLLTSNKLEAEAAAKRVDVVKYSKMPSIDVSYQAGFGTANNLIGIFYPNGILPMSGPPSLNNRYDPGTGSAASLLLNWQAITFGQRNAEINTSIAEANTKKSEWQQSLFQHKINVISIYLDLLLSYDVVSIHQKNIERTQTNLNQSRILTNAGTKPGVDTALFLSELAKAKIDLLNAQKQLQINQLLLQQLIICNALPAPTDTSFLSFLPVKASDTDTSFSNVPIMKTGQNRLLLSQSKEQLLKKSYLPKLNVWATGFARGSAFQASGDIKTWDGLGLNRYNYGAGLQIAFPIMKYGEVRRQLQQQQLISKAAQEKLADSKLVLNTQRNVANAAFNSNMAISTETENQLASGRYAFGAMQMRYNTGLVSFADLMQAQFNLLKAELDVRKAHWDAWKALLLQTAINGDENIFLNEIR